ncbi:MAG: hypothetical protein ACP5K1_06650 [Candidatus Bathyarchaeia archaeon]
MAEMEGYAEKIRRAALLLMYRRGRMPGAREWELKAVLGKDHLKVLDRLNQILSELGLEVYRLALEEGDSRYLVRVKGSMTRSQAKLCGWRIDHLAALAAAIADIVSKQGKSNRRDLEELLSRKIGRWRGLNLIEGFIRSGYLEEDEDGMISLGWRTLAEVELKDLMTLILGASQDERAAV